MNWFDLTILAILLISVVVSLFRGLIREVMSLIIWVAAFWLAWHYVDVGANWLQAYIELPSARHLIAFVALFLSALIVGGLINFLLGKIISGTGLTGTDRFLGMFFGLLRGAVAVTAMVLFLQATPLSSDPWWQQSTLQPHFSKLADWVKQRMPDDIGEYFSFMNDETIQQSLRSGLPTNNESETSKPAPNDNQPQPQPVPQQPDQQ
ncbi:CvpA family protein [Marinicella gelatinilytica]|uniref:CvpA family protein n=1 Tax=Marinicella gelatinilytica TaxID=2996017 RepID=UPI002260FEC1|nr:CvpA family protein [Marinicella gelatinilytica]MCX7545969.1 CvpA family protein [Marinicella gelatinilytica]